MICGKRLSVDDMCEVWQVWVVLGSGCWLGQGVGVGRFVGRLMECVRGGR